MSESVSTPARVPGWWHSAVIYQIYPRSFAASNGTGFGDIPGIMSKLPKLAELGVDAIWLSPFYTSPQKDAGYDVADYCDVDPLFGSLADAEKLIETAHSLGLRIIVDLVPNHSSGQHEWFQAALASEPGSAERARYIFRDGQGDNGELPPNNWHSVFGGPAWTRVTEPDGTPGQWYLHLFDSSQPDFDWTNQDVWDHFDRVLRFWLERGVDGFRIDVAHGLMKAEGLPDLVGDQIGDTSPEGRKPYWDQDAVHEVYRHWHGVLTEYGDDRILTAEAWVWPLSRMANYVRADEMHQAFNFAYLSAPWNLDKVKAVIDDSLEAFGAVGAPSTWVLSNHDVVRHTSRLALPDSDEHLTGLGPKSPVRPDPVLAVRRGRAATALMLALPGSSFLYQGEELGLLEVIDIPDDLREDPTFHRTHGERYGRDGCRVPIPWEAHSPGFGFSSDGSSWLPQPEWFADFARDQQEGVEGSTLEFYKELLRLRRQYDLGNGTLSWETAHHDSVLSFTNGVVTVATNFGSESAPLPTGLVVASSVFPTPDMLEPDHTVWLVRD